MPRCSKDVCHFVKWKAAEAKGQGIQARSEIAGKKRLVLSFSMILLMPCAYKKNNLNSLEKIPLTSCQFALMTLNLILNQGGYIG